MKRTSRRRKVVDDTTVMRCVSGMGVLREEVWQDDCGEVVRYNLVFINRLLCGVDNSRVLGYDALLDTFLAEVASLRKERV